MIRTECLILAFTIFGLAYCEIDSEASGSPSFQNFPNGPQNRFFGFLNPFRPQRPPQFGQGPSQLPFWDFLRPGGFNNNGFGNGFYNNPGNAYPPNFRYRNADYSGDHSADSFIDQSEELISGASTDFRNGKFFGDWYCRSSSPLVNRLCQYSIKCSVGDYIGGYCDQGVCVCIKKNDLPTTTTTVEPTTTTTTTAATTTTTLEPTTTAATTTTTVILPF